MNTINKPNTMSKLNEIDKEVILAFAANNMNICKTASKVYLHRNTVAYRLNKIKDETGLNPFKFYDLLQLLRIIVEEQRQERVCENNGTI